MVQGDYSQTTFFTNEIKNKFPIYEYIFNKVKEFFFNEFEITYWSILFEKIEWVKSKNSIEDYIYFISLLTKVITF